jgi:hypothetical protein
MQKSKNSTQNEISKGVETSDLSIDTKNICANLK